MPFFEAGTYRVAAEERSEAAIGDEVVVNPVIEVCLKHPDWMVLRLLRSRSQPRSAPQRLQGYRLQAYGRYKCACPARYSDESAKLSLASTRPTRIKAVRLKPLA